MGISHGVKLPDGTVVVKGNAHQAGKIACMGCQGEAHEVVMANGKKVYQCINCGRQWSSTKF